MHDFEVRPAPEAGLVNDASEACNARRRSLPDSCKPQPKPARPGNDASLNAALHCCHVSHPNGSGDWSIYSFSNPILEGAKRASPESLNL